MPGVVEFFGWFFSKKTSGDRIGLSGLVMCLPGAGSRRPPEIGEVLSARHVGHQVADVEIAFVPDRTTTVVPFVHASAIGHHVFAFWLRSGPQKNPPLHRWGNVGTGQCKPGFWHVDKTDNLFHRLTRLLCRIERAELFGDANDQGTMDAGVKQKPFAAGEHATVIGVVDDNRIVCESRSGERVENISH